MRYYVDALQAIFTGIHNSLPEDLNTCPLTLLLQHIYTYNYIKLHLIEEPLAKYPFITKESSLKKVYTALATAVKNLTQVYLDLNTAELLKTLQKCYNKNWIQYSILQPLRTDVAYFLTSLTLVSGDISLYISQEYVHCSLFIVHSPPIT